MGQHDGRSAFPPVELSPVDEPSVDLRRELRDRVEPVDDRRPIERGPTVVDELAQALRRHPELPRLARRGCRIPRFVEPAPEVGQLVVHDGDAEGIHRSRLWSTADLHFGPSDVQYIACPFLAPTLR